MLSFGKAINVSMVYQSPAEGTSYQHLMRCTVTYLPLLTTPSPIRQRGQLHTPPPAVQIPLLEH